MSMRNSVNHWGGVSKTFHWLIVLLLLFQGGLGLFMGDLPREMRADTVALHKSIGATILMLVILRIIWALFAGRPGPVPGVSMLNHRLARAGHALLYLLLLALPISGALMSAYAGRPVEWFGLFSMPTLPVAQNPEMKEWMEEAHEWLFWSLTLVAMGHAAFAVYHHMVKGDATLARMMPRGWLREPERDA
ncbi:cytochrome b [Luteimonas sp. e5]